MTTLVVYDISSDEIRTKLANRLFDYGLERIQYSAFKGELNTHDRDVLVKELHNFIGGEHDSIYVISLCDRCARLCKIVSEKTLPPLVGKEKVKLL